MIKEACEAVEALDGIPVKNSSLNASVNMESLCCELEQQPNLLQVSYDLHFLYDKKKPQFSFGMNLPYFLESSEVHVLTERLMIVV